MILPITGKNELGEWYNRKCLEKAARIKPISRLFFRVIKIYVGFYVFVVGLYMLYFYFRSNSSVWSDFFDRMNGPFIFSILFFVIMALITYALAKDRITSLSSMEGQGKVTLLADNKGASLRNDVQALALKMGIEVGRIVIWKAIAANPFPSVEEDKYGRIHLVVPVNFFLYHKNCKKEAFAVLAHELGHVLQKDTELYAVADAYFSIVRLLFVPTLSLNIVAILGELIALDLNRGVPAVVYYLVLFSAVFNVILLLYLLNGSDKIKEARKDSEILADTASILYSDNDSIIKVLRESESKIKANLNLHPSNVVRLDHLFEIIYRYQLTFVE